MPRSWGECPSVSEIVAADSAGPLGVATQLPGGPAGNEPVRSTQLAITQYAGGLLSGGGPAVTGISEEPIYPENCIDILCAANGGD
jgi:hypothetical protein